MKADIDTEVDQLECEIQDLKRRVSDLRRRRPKETVRDYALRDMDGNQIRLSSLFGDKDSLILVHNMGSRCDYCTMWADGFVGLFPYLASRSAFVLTSPDEPRVQRQFAVSRGWTFPLCSAHGTSFIEDMGFVDPEDGLMPGFSIFEKEPDGSIYRVSRGEFGPGDDYCAVWHFMDLLPEGVNGWEPKLSYGTPASQHSRHG